MMVPKWMIGACVAVAAMAIGVEAEAQISLVCPSSVQVANQSSKPVKVTYVWKKNQTEGVVAPKSVGLVCPSFAGATEDSFVSVKVGKLAARRFKISANEVRKLYERSGFTPDEAAVVIDVRVNKYGVVELRRFYLRKVLPA
jgi:Na+(H+)/acetate symporter ActP